MLTFTTDQWVIIALVFVLGLLVGMWLTSGGRRKWKNRYNEELEKRRSLERDLKDRESHWATQEKEWRQREATLSGPPPARDRDRDGYPDRGPEPYADRGPEPYRDRGPDDRPIIGRHPADDRRY